MYPNRPRLYSGAFSFTQLVVFWGKHINQVLMKSLIQIVFALAGLAVMVTSYQIGVPDDAGVSDPHVYVPMLAIVGIVISYVLVWNKWFRTKPNTQNS